MTTLAGIDVSSLCVRLVRQWTDNDLRELERELAPYINAMRAHFASGVPIPSHLPRTASLCAPITPITDPWQLYAEAEGSVSAEKFHVQEYADYWITAHYSAVPVVILLLKRYPGPLPRLDELCRLCAGEIGAGVGPTRYFQWNLPGFAWAMHTDDEYEGVSARVHVPFYTTPDNLFAWAASLDATPQQWIRAEHLERGRVYLTRVDVPHTAINNHPTDARLHLILDVSST